MKKIFFALLISFTGLSAQNTKPDPLSIAQKIAERVMIETSFDFTEVEQKPSIDLQVIDFSKAYSNRNVQNVYAFAKIFSPESREYDFGISYSEPLKIWINDKLVFQNLKHVKFSFKEIAYDIFAYQNTFSVKLKKGANRIVAFTPRSKNSVIYIREITEAEKKPIAIFTPIHKEKNYTWPWCFLEGSKVIPAVNADGYPGKSFLDSLYSADTFRNYPCTIPKPNLIKKLVSNPRATFKKDSYADWNYPNGILMATIADLTDETENLQYKKFVEKYCDLIFGNISQFRNQYYEEHDLRGSYYRIFRKCMLDDAGAPSLPFAELELISKNTKYKPLLDTMIKYVFSGQSRLQDGTLCRPEPEKWTVWADDLFMSVPLFVRAAKIYNDKKYIDEAAKQVINFNKYLFDSEKGIYKHGWFSKPDQKSNVFWGRANGWIIWATSELIMSLPKNHPLYNKVEKIFTAHLKGLLRYQDVSGMWHQILDDKSSFEETSCTSMFIIGLSRAIRSGILDKKYSENVLRAWNALQNNISNEGIVKDICCGTGIGNTAEFYKTRERLNNDPRGLGAVILSAVEIDKLQKYLRDNK